MGQATRVVPDLHTYRGLSLAVPIALRARVLGKYAIQRTKLFGQLRRDLQGLRQLEGSQRDARALVIAGGPSTNLLDAEKVKRHQQRGLQVFALNMYNASRFAREIVPEYYCLSDPAFFGEIDSMRADVVASWEYIERHRCHVVVPVGARLPVELDPEPLRFNNLGLEGWVKHTDPRRARGYSAMVAFSALAVGLHLGYRRIYISGLDNNQFRKLYRDSSGRLRYHSGTHHHPTDWSNYEVGQVGERNIYRGGVSAYFEDVARIFAEARLFAGNRIAHVDSNTLFDAFDRLGVDDLDLLSGESAAI